MDIYSTILRFKKRIKSSSPKIPGLPGNKIKISFFFFVGLGISIVGMLFLTLFIQKSEGEESKLSSSPESRLRDEDRKEREVLFDPFATTREAELFDEENLFVQEKLLIFNENTLFSIANPFNPAKAVKKLPVIVTAYSSTPQETDGSPYITAAGTWVREGIVANNKYPFGTKIRIPEIYGDKVFVVEDRMNSRKGYYHIDIWFPSYWEAKNFGAKRTYIEVLEG